MIVKSSRHIPPSDSEAVLPVPWIVNVSKSVKSVGSYYTIIPLDIVTIISDRCWLNLSVVSYLFRRTINSKYEPLKNPGPRRSQQTSLLDFWIVYDTAVVSVVVEGKPGFWKKF